MNSDEFRLARFLNAQESSYTTALRELRSGRKRSHWIWYVFPQLRGLGHSSNSEIYGLAGLSEARAFLANPLLRSRLVESIEAMLASSSSDASIVLGELDALKFRSSLTLFALADPSIQIFSDALERFFDGQQDARTLELLSALDDI